MGAERKYSHRLVPRILQIDLLGEIIALNTWMIEQ
jgi:hypothetical protein